ncbi:hypothetical protein FOZ63_030702 [Perkinsus olseni]|uniref:Uncharacterized protein n=1 Tax=Perkinsus olseni TaxID=32597 RepID=A0A7J6UK40_PEROL|nr:hypothetical protein FOZ62_000830 [Perkinsus olseni]KAF4757388.1 hypothetical protein FOZ63_030702 [Perkinsus olseni]
MSCRSTDEEVSRASADGEFDDTTPSPTLDDEITFHRDNAVRFLKDLKAYTADDDDGASAYLEDLVESISYLEACQSRKGGELTRPELPTKSLDSHTTRGASPQPDYDSECTSTLTRQFTGRGHSRRGEPNEDRWKYYHPHNVRVDVTSSGMMDSVKANDEGFADERSLVSQYSDDEVDHEQSATTLYPPCPDPDRGCPRQLTGSLLGRVYGQQCHAVVQSKDCRQQ